MHNAEIDRKLELCIESFKSVLYEKDETFLENMAKTNIDQGNLARYMLWEWTQGVGLYGLWKLFEKRHDQRCLQVLTEYYDARIAEGLPGKNVNTMAPILALSYLYEYTRNETYGKICLEWAEWAMHEMPRAGEGGMQHVTSDRANPGELWDDTLFMTVLPLANVGRIFNRQDYIDEAVYQFLVHIKYLADKKTGLWYHGFCFDGCHNFAEAFWGRGNSWATIAIPTLFEIVDIPDQDRRFIANAFVRQVESVARYQDEGGMWHTLIDDPTSYLEASATAGFGCGILKGIKAGLLDESYRAVADRALAPLLDCIDDKGVVQQVSYGTPMGRESKDFYKQIPLHPMPYGQAMAILFLLEEADA